MPRHIWTVLCRSAIIDGETNVLSLLEVIEQLTSREPLARGVAVLSMELTTLWTRSKVDVPEQGRSKMILSGPAGPIGDPEIQEVNLTQHTRLRNRLKMDGFPTLQGPGVYEFEIQVEGSSLNSWETVARIPVELLEERPEAATVQPS